MLRWKKDPQTAERFLTVPTDISGVLNTSPTEDQGICSHYVKRGLRAPFLGERLPSDLSIQHITRRIARKQEVIETERQVPVMLLPTLRRAIRPGHAVVNGWRRDERTRDARRAGPPQYRSNKCNDVEEWTFEVRGFEVLRELAVKLGAYAFDDARIEAKPARRQQLAAQLLQESA
jgi:hypothetical protein